MARIDSKVLFITTSPRTPAKMIPEIRLLHEHFEGEVWNHDNQVAFMDLLREENFFNGEGAKDPAFSARDRINRAPQSLGFVELTPTIRLTKAGAALIQSKRTEEIFLRQLLKFQVPSPYHRPTTRAGAFWGKPYLELFRLIRHFGSLAFDELRLFGLQLLDYRDFEKIVKKIDSFRIRKAANKGQYRRFYFEEEQKELESIYKEELQSGRTKTRETLDDSREKFLETKASNLRDYADACFRYLRATGLVSISKSGKSISIIPEKLDDVDFFLASVERDPCFVDDMYHYVEYLGDDTIPVLMTDDVKAIISLLRKVRPGLRIPPGATLAQLKELLYTAIDENKEAIIKQQVRDIKQRKLYEDIDEVFTQITEKKIYDPSLMFEWNVWRAMTMIDGGDIKANLRFDDFGYPLSTAQGNMADIVCDYGDFGLIVEVTLSTGQRQYETEGEPVARHLAKYKESTGRASYCLFIAPIINPAALTHFFYLHKIPSDYYKGYSYIIPMELAVFRKMVEDSYKAKYIPTENQMKVFFEKATEIAQNTTSEVAWFNGIKEMALNWLT